MLPLRQARFRSSHDHVEPEAEVRAETPRYRGVGHAVQELAARSGRRRLAGFDQSCPVSDLTPPTPGGVLEAALYARDLIAAEQFYSQVLGLMIIARQSQAEAGT